MKRFLAICSLIFLAGCGVSHTSAASTCYARDGGKLPDPMCTPGVTASAVTQKNISTTICVSGYSSRVRPPESYTEPLKKEQIILYGYSDQRVSDYEEDHLISLELGGSPKNPKNLWPEFPRTPNSKDRLENRLHKMVCDHSITLASAQHEIATNWVTVYKSIFGTNPTN